SRGGHQKGRPTSKCSLLLLTPLPSSSPLLPSPSLLPLHSSRQDMFEGHEEDIRNGGLSVGVPGEIAGLYLAWQRHSRLTWRDLVTPAADMAESGFHVAAYLANSIATYNATILSDPGLSAVFAPGGKLLKKGDTCYRPALAAILKAIAEKGPDVFYRGERARALVKEIQAMGGILTEQDLESFQAQVREVLLGKAFGLDFLMAPPPSSGGAVILQVLKILQGYELPLASAGDGQLKAVVGGAGGTVIISAVLQVILHFFCQGYSPFKAIDAPRIHHQLLPNTVFYEAGHALDDGERISVPNATLAALVRRNHSTFPIAFGGFVQFIVQDLDGPATAALKDLDGPAGAALQKLDGPDS
ncbi:unnamed protein product, partial [Closterium sp. NIES-53]